MTLGLRGRIVLIAAAVLLAAMAAIVAASGIVFADRYAGALQSRSLAVANSLKLQLERVLALGIQVPNLTGFDAQCQEAVNAYQGISHAFVALPDGSVLFSGGAQFTDVIADAAFKDALKSVKDTVVRVNRGETDVYLAVVPVLDRGGAHVATVVVGFPASRVAEELRDMLKLDAGAGAIVLAVGIVLLLAALTAFVTRPLARVIAAVQRIGASGEDLSVRVPGPGAGEIGVLIDRFNHMLDQVESQAELKQQIRTLAYFDGLTGLPNRVRFHSDLERLLRQAERDGNILAVVFLDLDGFKNINDTLGHAIGDKLLKAVAERLSVSIRGSDTIARGADDASMARFGGDEFTLVLTGLARPEDATPAAQRFIALLGEPFTVDDHELFVSASLGIATYPADGRDAETLLRSADAAMYHAKDSGRNNYQFYSEELNRAAVERMDLERDLRVAVERGELQLHYQPLIDVSTHSMYGVEALLRWRSARRGLVPPSVFIPVAEQSGLIGRIGEWVLREACRQTRAWQQAGVGSFVVSVNVSGMQFKDRGFVTTVQSALSSSGLDPRLLVIEATETIVLENRESTLEMLRALRQLGVSVALDDFGTGYSSLAYLKRFPLDTLKIDRSFVSEVDAHADDVAIVRAIVALATTLGFDVVAEGVETKAQADRLLALGCTRMQGYLFSRPVPADEIAGLAHRLRVPERDDAALVELTDVHTSVSA